jgi:type II secretory pathway pseudopilin PulG
MPPGEIALIAILVIAALAGATYVTQKRSAADERQQQRLGAANAKQLQLQGQRICVECNKQVDAAVGDVFDKGTWWCRSCYQQVVSVASDDV